MHIEPTYHLEQAGLPGATVRTLVVSDLHIFSDFDPLDIPVERVAPLFDGYGLVVLNGDIFDLEWNGFHTLREAERAAVELIEEWMRTWPAARFVVLSGNHDYHAGYGAGLRALAAANDRLLFAGDQWRAGAWAFTHGDAAHLGRGTLDALRMRASRTRAKSRRIRRFYRRVVPACRLAWWASRVPRRYWLSRVLRYLQGELGTAYADVRHVFSGHFHIPYANYLCGRRLCHNTGGLAMGIRLRPIAFELPRLELERALAVHEREA